ncbi:hypothetical protein [Pseudomarimonas salicorniae]|uniref:Uncharacterized protein n=1 Tax=Pseudomarimonas salicorniae TaxID=2933270 RepID=A0ABT0GCU6_9GAMM|nr:hypothetical protein [Lysobacter sp. CAU 1642]MCK7592351.1 hypothetical protein [Lysobacter sp. CAU 1642]
MNLSKCLLAAALAAPCLSVCAQSVGGEFSTAIEVPAEGFVALAKGGLAIEAPAPEAEQIDALRAENAAPGAKALKVGLEQATREGATPLADSLSWQRLGDGRWAARLAVHSPGAEALRVALEPGALPAGSRLAVAADAAGQRGLVELDAMSLSAQLRQDSRLWTPVTSGDVQHIELVLPAGSDPKWVRLSVPAVSWLLVDPAGAYDAAKIGESGACEVDVRCVSNPTEAFNNTRRAVTRMLFQQGGSTFSCTGTLLNDTDTSTQIPWIYSAAHCFTQQSVANTLTTFWFYEATGCGTNRLDSGSRQVAGGGTVRYADESSDVLFYRLNNAPPTGSFYLGWDAATVQAGTDVVAVHHPAGDVMKVSIGGTTGIGPSNLAPGSFIKAGYTTGTTEGGSSGCGLLTSDGAQFFLRGGLLGGSASCNNTGALNNPGNTDDYSRFDLAFAQLRHFLFPTSAEPPSNINYTGAWSNPSQDGWGLVVIRGGTGAYGMYIYHYDQDRTPAWYLSSGTLSGTRFNADLFAFNGPWFGEAMFNPAQVTARDAGSLSVTFNSETQATISFTIDGRTVSTTLNKLVF